MNREILFRGKRVDNGEWVYGDLIKNLIYDGREKEIRIGDIYFEHNGDIHGTAVREVIPETVEQFTGVCDKNGNKIFEGDIVKVTYTEQRQYLGVSYQDEHSCVEEVIYNEKSACFMLKIMCEDVPLYRPLHNFGSLTNIKELEVIGNIYDNPELLEEKL